LQFKKRSIKKMFIDIIKDILPVIIFLSLLIVVNKRFSIKQRLRSRFLTDDMVVDPTKIDVTKAITLNGTDNKILTEECLI